MRRVVFNQKGGVGKTTIVCNLAAIAAANGLRTLVIDLDPQCNSTQYLLGSGEHAAETGAADFFENTLSFKLKGAGLDRFVTETPFENLDLVAAHPDLEHLQIKLEARQKVYKLKQALDKLSAYDAVYIDTPPALNFYSRSALIAANRCLIPFDCDDFARQALYTLLDNIAELREDHNDALEIEGIVVNQFQSRARQPRQLVEELRNEGLPVLEHMLNSSVKVRESHDSSLPLVHGAPGHKLTRQFDALYASLNGHA